MPLLTEEEFKGYSEVPVENVARKYVARYWDLMALAANEPAKVIGEDALLKDKPGFEVDFLTRGSVSPEIATRDKPTVLMPVRGHRHLPRDGDETVPAPGDTVLMNAGGTHGIKPSMTGEASLYRITATDDPAGATWTGS